MNIVICMGSSCYSRGNSQLIELIEQLIAGREDISLSGKLCINQCASGPHITIDGVQYDGKDKAKILEIIQKQIEVTS